MVCSKAVAELFAKERWHRAETRHYSSPTLVHAVILRMLHQI